MNPQDERELYQRLAKVHETWQALPESERAAWLADLQRKDPQLSMELEELNSASERAGALFADEGIERRGGLPLANLIPDEDLSLIHI